MHITIYTDGGSRGNPGEGAVGVMIHIKYQIANSKKQEEKIVKFGKRIGVCTNNEAEYMAVVEALQNLKLQIANLKLPVEKIQFFLDSSLVCNQLKGLFKVKEPRMRA